MADSFEAEDPLALGMRITRFIRLVRDNALATYPAKAFNEATIACGRLHGARFIINEPAAIRHVLLDDAANYTKSDLVLGKILSTYPRDRLNLCVVGIDERLTFRPTSSPTTTWVLARGAFGR